MVVFFVLAHHLGLREFGVLAFVIAYVEIFRVVADFGVDTALMRHLAITARAGRLIGSAALLKSFLALASYALGFGIAYLLGYPQRTLMMLGIALLGLFLSSGSNLFNAPFQTVLESRRIVWTGVAGTFAYVLFTGTGVKMGQGVVYFILAALFAELIGFALAAAVLQRHMRLRWEGWHEPLALLHDALPLGAITVLVIGYGRVGILLLESIRGTADVGTYAIALRIVETVTLLAGALAGSAYPAFARHLARNEILAARALYGNLYRHVTAGATVIALMLVFLSSMFRLINSEAATAAPALSVLAWAAVFIFGNQMSSAILLAAGLGPAILAIAAGNLSLNIVLNVLLIPNFGSVGVALALLVTESINALLQGLVVWKRFRVGIPAGPWLRASAACTVAIVSMVHASSALVPVVLVLYFITAGWQKDVSLRWLLAMFKPASASHGEHEGIA
jgi:O-antigen/teichoic acid export membrane protein